jgi:hypothetical protein
MVAKKSKKKLTHKEDFTKRGKEFSEVEFDNMVKEGDESGYLTSEELKKKCLSLLNFK